jgi:hypothetical protein
MEDNRAGHVHRLIKVSGCPKRPRADRMRVRRDDALVDQVGLEVAWVAVDGSVLHQGFEHLDPVAVGEFAVAKVTAIGEREPVVTDLVHRAGR